MLGISIYFKDLDYNYLKQARKIGAKYLFTSFHIPEEDSNLIKKELPNFLTKVKELGFTLVPDISPHTFEKFDLKDNDFKGLSDLGIKAIRLDYGIDDLNLIKELEDDFEIIFNASTISESYLKDIKKTKMNLENISFLHNFYPRTDTAISEETFKNINQKFIDSKIDIMAFVTGDSLRRFPLYEGLPTLEKHRDVNPYLASLDLIKNYKVNTVFIGDSKAKLITLQMINEYLTNNIVSVPVILEEDYKEYYGKTFSTRRDPSKNIVRLNSPRTKGIKPVYNNNRVKGSITIENDLAGRYSGELNIHKTNNTYNSRSNVVGYIHPEYINIVDLVDNSKIKFIKI